ncbi:MAG: ABC transporter ATP-binding protein [Clostridiaceae bacterium]|jgi:ABC-2 type transport system ATP-binding protein|nr:ABC transporter ATP-binding protein [Clostridiaceae bacterium]
MLSIRNLTKIFPGNKIAVNDLNLEVAAGEIFGFIGPNGAGKSTTIKCITGILNFERGEISVCGKDVKRDSVAAKKSIGYVSDSHIIYDKLTGLEFVTFMCDVYGVPTADRVKKLDEYLTMFGMKDVAKAQIRTYSHGMKQKISVIGAIIHDPKLLILDEPLTGLDPQSAFQLKEFMRSYASAGNTVFFSSHVLDVVEKVCDRIGIIDGGSLIAACTFTELRERGLDSSLEELFLKITSKDSVHTSTASENDYTDTNLEDGNERI